MNKRRRYKAKARRRARRIEREASSLPTGSMQQHARLMRLAEAGTTAYFG